MAFGGKLHRRGETMEPVLKTRSTWLSRRDLVSFTPFETRLEPWHGKVPGYSRVSLQLELAKSLLLCVSWGEFQSFAKEQRLNSNVRCD